MRAVLDRLLLSDLSEANDPFFLQHHRVEAVLYFGNGGLFPEDIKLYHRPQPPKGELSAEDLGDGIVFLRESLSAGRRVLAVGPTGATIVVAYLVEMGFGSAQALQLVGEGRGSAPSPDPRPLAAHAQLLTKRRLTSVHG